MEIRPLSDALGAEVIGLDLGSAMTDATFETVHRAFLDHCLLVFRDQDLTPDRQVAFSARFGSLTEHVIDQFLLPGHPQILRISNKKDAGGQNVGLVDAGRYWHSDLSYAEVPSLGSMLYSLEIPPPGKGGDTLFANLRAAYETVPVGDEGAARRVEGRSTWRAASGSRTTTASPERAARASATPGSRRTRGAERIRRRDGRRSSSNPATPTTWSEWILRRAARCSTTLSEHVPAMPSSTVASRGCTTSSSGITVA